MSRTQPVVLSESDDEQMAFAAASTAPAAVKHAQEGLGQLPPHKRGYKRARAQMEAARKRGKATQQPSQACFKEEGAIAKSGGGKNAEKGGDSGDVSSNEASLGGSRKRRNSRDADPTHQTGAASHHHGSLREAGAGLPRSTQERRDPVAKARKTINLTMDGSDSDSDSASDSDGSDNEVKAIGDAGSDSSNDVVEIPAPRGTSVKQAAVQGSSADTARKKAASKFRPKARPRYGSSTAKAATAAAESGRVPGSSASKDATDDASAQGEAGPGQKCFQRMKERPTLASTPCECKRKVKCKRCQRCVPLHCRCADCDCARCTQYRTYAQRRQYLKELEEQEQESAEREQGELRRGHSS
eukprot:scaffold1804_cov263-Pinguiococcus_pyrenoidosus.AAC.25